MGIMQQSKQPRLYFEETLEVTLSPSSEMSIAADYSQRLTNHEHMCVKGNCQTGCRE